MRIDLEQALHEIASSVQDDVASDDLGGRVHHLVSRVRRRRAARYAAQGVAGVGTAAAVAVVGVNVVGTPEPDVAPPATTLPEPGPDPDRATNPAELRRLVCGGAAPEPTGTTVHGLTLELPSPVSVELGKSLALTATVRNDSDTTLDLAGSDTDLQLVAVVDGRIVGEKVAPGTSGGAVPADGRLRPGDTAELSETGRFAACGGITALTPGDYVLMGRTALNLVGGEVVELVSEAVPFTVVDPDGSADDAARSDEERARQAELERVQEAREAVERYLSTGVTSDQFPACGTAMPHRGDEPLVAEVSELGTNHAPWTPGSVLDATVTIRSTDHRTVLGNVDVTAGGSVLLQDGVVVGGVAQPPGREPELLEITAVGEPTAGTVRLVVCGTDHLDDGPLPLPPGDYELVATATVALKEIVDEDTGEAVSDSRIVVARSEPEPFTVD